MPVNPAISVHLLPGLVDPGALRGGVAIVVDVLRATTVMVKALSAGCESVMPCREIEEAYEIAAGLPPDSYLIAGERQGVPIPGFDLGNSPREFTPLVCGGKTLLMTTTNGTRAILSCIEAERVLVAAFSNLGATAHALREDPRPKHIVCAGTDNHVSFEDAALAGALVWELTTAVPWLHSASSVRANDEAELVLAMWTGLMCQLDAGEPLETIFGLGRGGRLLRQLDYQVDIRDSARMDHLDFTAELLTSPLRIVRRR